MEAEELDDRRVVGLEGIIRLAYWGADGHQRLDVQGFASSERWEELAGEPAVCAASVEIVHA
jgi:hypothetical protein